MKIHRPREYILSENPSEGKTSRPLKFIKEDPTINLFEQIKTAVTARQAAEHYGMSVSSNGMTLCPFHDDHTPSMKVDKRYYCFGCGEHGDSVDLVAKLFGLPCYDAAKKLCRDFGIHADCDRYESFRS